MIVWNSVSEFFHMGGHAPFVFGAYAIVFCAIVLESWLVARRLSAAKRVLKRTIALREAQGEE